MLQIGVNEPVFLELSHLKTHINVAAGAALQQSVPNAFCFVSHARFRFCLHYILQTFGNLSCSGPFLPAVLLPGMAFWWQLYLTFSLLQAKNTICETPQLTAEP